MDFHLNERAVLHAICMFSVGKSATSETVIVRMFKKKQTNQQQTDGVFVLSQKD